MANFKKGNRICNKYNGLVYIVKDVLTSSYEIEDITSKSKWLVPFESENEWELMDKECHLWTIQDAKEGDVLYSLDSFCY